MKAVVQVVKSCEVKVNGTLVGKGGRGLFVLLGVREGDTKAEAELLARKVCNLRVLCDSDDKMNLSVLDLNQEVTIVSNFTLEADTAKGNRPSFINAARPETAEPLYEYFIECVKLNGVRDVATGQFGADMKIDVSLDGPVTILLDTDTWRK
ncbi:MAG: D-tyrosyl-tRNA(Tyr) deacylase [Clostridia bacterium]|nr:D-tyrosyl-tRNA(Tyr) deacylase [Clostridia bacterium]